MRVSVLNLIKLPVIFACFLGCFTAFGVEDCEGLFSVRLQFVLDRVPETEITQVESYLRRIYKNEFSLNHFPREEIEKLSLASRLELAKAYLKLESSGVPNPQGAIELFHLSSEESRFALAKDFVQYKPWTAVEKIKYFNLEIEENRFEIAMLATKKAALEVGRSIKKVPLSSSEHRYALAKAVLENGGASHFQSLIERADFLVSEKNELFLLAAKNIDESNLQGFKSKSAPLLNYGDIDAKTFEKAQNILLRRFGVEYLATKWRIEQPQSVEDLKRSLHIFSKEHPDVLPPEWISSLWDRVIRRETGLELLKMQFGLREKGFIPPKDSLEILGKTLGFSDDFVNGLRSSVEQKKISHDALARFYEICIDLHRGEENPIFKNPKFLEKTWTQPSGFHDLTEALASLRDLRSIKVESKSEHHWKDFVSRFHHMDPKELASEIKAEVVREVQRLFNSENLKFSYEQLKELEEKWGGLEPIFTLVARFNGNPKWRQENRILAEIFEASLRDDFYRYKFLKDSTLQLESLGSPSSLSDQKLKAWIRTRSTLTLHSVSKDSNSMFALQRSNIHSIFETNFIPHYREFKQSRSFDKSIEQELDLALSQLREASKNEPKTVASIATSLLRNKDRFGFDAQLIADLKALQNASSSKVSLAGETIVFTTTLNDPKSLLTSGSLVNTSSCQDYRCGSFIHTLPGYVLDANVQMVASFGLKAGNFSNPRDFETVIQAFYAGKKVEYSFDPFRRVLTFRVEGHLALISSKQLEHAYARHMVRLGENRFKKPGILLERGYFQSQGASVQMNQDIRKVINEMATELGASTNEPILVRSTRNPLGIYSDSAGGVQTGDFTMKP